MTIAQSWLVKLGVRHQLSMGSKINTTVNSLWIGDTLSYLELLTLHSFAQKGHQFNLWSYNNFDQKLPEAVRICDANEIIPENEVFSYQNETDNGLGKGSVAGFSDIFRYKLLYDRGGWWVDMDVTCLFPLDVAEPYFFPSEDAYLVTGKILKTPKKCDLMRDCYLEAKASVNEHNTNYGKPIEILVKNVIKHKLEAYIKRNFVNIDGYVLVDLARHTHLVFDSELRVFHWCHELWRRFNLDKNLVIEGSTFQQLLETNKVLIRDDYKSEKIELSKRKKFQLLLFRVLYRYSGLWQLLKRIRHRVVKKQDFWIP